MSETRIQNDDFDQEMIRSIRASTDEDLIAFFGTYKRLIDVMEKTLVDIQEFIDSASERDSRRIFARIEAILESYEKEAQAIEDWALEQIEKAEQISKGENTHE